MRRMVFLGLLAGFVLSNAGCLGISVHRGVQRCDQCREQVVVVSGEIYIVNVQDNSVRKINPQDAIEAELPTTAIE